MHLILNDIPCAGNDGVLASSSRVAIELLDTGHVTRITFGPAWRAGQSGCDVAAYIRAAVSAQHIPRMDWSVLSDDFSSRANLTNTMEEVDEVCRVRGEQSVQVRLDLATCMRAGLLPEFSFDTFDVDEGNTLAYTYAFLGALNFCGDPNPLFIQGPSGSGKTHLIHAIGLCRLRFDEQVKLCYLNAKQIRGAAEVPGEGEALARMKGIRNIEAFLLDDLHLVDNSRSAQERLIQIIQPLIDAGKQVVLTSRKSLNELAGFDEGLLALLFSGMSVSLNQISSLSSLMQSDSTIT